MLLTVLTVRSENMLIILLPAAFAPKRNLDFLTREGTSAHDEAGSRAQFFWAWAKLRNQWALQTFCSEAAAVTPRW